MTRPTRCSAGCSTTCGPTPSRVRPRGRHGLRTGTGRCRCTCHGAARQVDVLREVLVGLLGRPDPGAPRHPGDVPRHRGVRASGPRRVRSPTSPARGGTPGAPAARAPRRPGRRAPPLLSLAAVLVELAGGRVTATEVLDLASADPVRRRFGFTDDDLAQLAMWVDQAGIRWGSTRPPRLLRPRPGRQHLVVRARADPARRRDGRGRAALRRRDPAGRRRLEATSTWSAASASTSTAPRVRPGRRVRIDHHRVDHRTRDGGGAGGGGGATRRLADGAVRRELARMHDSAGDQHEAGSAAAGRARRRLADVRNLLAHRLGGRPTRSNFRTGTLTVCTMVPMRSVPHRVVCLVGLDDGVFPRTSSADGDDVLARNPLTGARRAQRGPPALPRRDPRGPRDAGRHLHRRQRAHRCRRPRRCRSVSCSTPRRDRGAAGARSRAGQAPAAAVRRTQPRPGRAGLRRAVQLRPGGTRRGEGRPRAEGTRERPRARSASRPAGDVALEDLQAFFAHPVRAFLRSRLDVSSPLEAEETRDAIPISLEGLEKWQIGDRLLAAVLGGTDPAMSVRAERLRGVLRPERWGRARCRRWRIRYARSSCRPTGCARVRRGPSTWTSTSAAGASPAPCRRSSATGS